MKVFAERLKELRAEKGFSTKKMGQELGYSGAAISRWENELQIPNIEVAAKVAEYFGVSTDFLLGLKDF